MSVLDKFNLKNKTAVVTGAAQGLGKAIAIGLAEAGANIIIPDINYEKAKKVAAEIKQLGVKSFAIETDVTSEKDIKFLVKSASDEVNSIDILVNNAGICKHIPAENMSKNDWEDVIDINLTGVFLTSKIIGKHMMKNGGGNIINMASMSGYIVNNPQPQSSYNASKAGVVHLTKSLAAEWAQHNIRVNAIAPGYMKTEMTEKDLEENREQIEEFWLKPTPMKRMGQPEELQGAALYLASDASSFMTGHTMIIDGGYTIY